MKVASFLDRFQSQVPADVLAQVAAHTLTVEDELIRQTGSRVALVQEVGRLTLAGGGKRLRPALVHLAAKATGRPFSAERAARLGAALEMVHMATLIHDDVIDHAATRRGKPTSAAVHGPTASILGGDVLLAKAMAILAADGDLSIIRTVSEAVVEMAEGEVHELEVRGRPDLDLDDHYRVLRMKTAAFIECCCRVGAKVTGATEPEEEALATYGHHLGLAFQIADDLLDYRGDPAKTGKPLATDFKEGQATLPLIDLWPKLNTAERDKARVWFGNGCTESDLRQVVEWMDERGSFRRTEEIAHGHVNSARLALADLPGNSERDLLLMVAEMVVQRDH